jgi:hypothetical protein
VTTLLDIAGALLVASFAFFVWPPAALLVLGVAVLFASWRMAVES